MAGLSRRSLLGLSAMLPFAGSASAEETAPKQSWPSPSEGAARARDRYRELHFPNVPLFTHEGKEVRFYDDLIKGKIVTLNFMYTSCGELCPLTTERLVKLQKLLGDRVGRQIFMYSLTIDPGNDTPEVLSEYMSTHRVKPGWTFLTGKPENLELLRRKLGFVDPDPKVDKDRSNHIGTIIYGNEPLMLWSGCPSLVRPEFMVKTISWVAQLKDFRP